MSTGRALNGAVEAPQLDDFGVGVYDVVGPVALGTGVTGTSESPSPTKGQHVVLTPEPRSDDEAAGPRRP
jgi:hypothetical protein